jgi:hypothetical protein
MYQMHRVFCATPWEMEAERILFYDLIGKFNETEAMSKRVLFVPVTLPSLNDKRPLQYTVDDNIRHCRYYILLLSEDWGPAERNFSNDYRLALACAADPALPMQDVAVLFKRLPAGPPPAASLPEPAATFSSAAEFSECLNRLLSGWLESVI